MADKIRGITIEIGGDTTGLTKSLKTSNAEIKDTQKQLKDVERLLKLDPTNVELLRQKEQLLNNEVAATSTKLEELKRLQETMDQNGVDRNSAQYQALQREIISTENELKSLQTEAAKSNSALAGIGAAADKVSQGAGKVASATKGLSTAAAGALAALGGLAYKSVTNADDLNTLAKQTGFTTEELQKMSYAADLIDVPMETITGAAAKMTKQLSSSEEKFTSLGVATRDSAGNLLSTQEIFYGTIAALSQVSNETERDALAMDIFGRSANELAGIIDDGGQGLRDYGNEAKELGLILDQDTLNGLNDVNDKIDQMKMRVQGVLATSGAKVVEALIPVIEKVAAVLERVLNFIGSLNEQQISTIMNILAVVAAISPIAGIISKIAGLVSGLMPILSSIFAFIAANPVVLVIAAIVAAVTALTVLIVNHWEEIKAAIGQVAEWVQTNIIEPIKNAFQHAFETVKTIVTTVISAVVNAVKSLINSVISAVENAINRVISRLNSVITFINRIINKANQLTGLNIGNIGTIGNVTLPKLATGGVLSAGSAIVGEAGPELLTMAGTKAVVQPLTAHLDSSSLAALSGSKGGSATTVNIEFTGSLAQLARILQPQIQVEAGRRGNSLINA